MKKTRVTVEGTMLITNKSATHDLAVQLVINENGGTISKAKNEIARPISRIPEFLSQPITTEIPERYRTQFNLSQRRSVYAAGLTDLLYQAE